MDQAEQAVMSRCVRPVAHAAVFGSFRLRDFDDREIVFSNRRARAVFALLCLDMGQAIEREYLARLFWPSRFEAHAKASLRQCLLELRKLLASLGPDVLHVTRSTITLRPEFVQTEIDIFEQAIADGAYADAVDQLIAISTKPMLDQLNFGAAFEEWLIRRRDAADKRLQASVATGLAALEQSGDLNMHARLSAAWSVRAPKAAHIGALPARDGNTRIAVLPFQALNANDGEDYFADGIVDEMITTLGRVPQLLVAGRTSSFHFRRSNLGSAAIADELGVAHLIEGSVQRQGDRVRIFVRLIDGATGFESWGQRYDGSLDDIFSLQETVAQAVAAALGEQLGLTIDQPMVRGMTRSKEAYDLYLQGKALGTRIFGEGVLDHAIDFLERSLAIDPLFAEAWVELAEAHHNVAVYTQCPGRNSEALRMADCARKAIALNPALGYPCALLGTYEWTRNNIVGGLDAAFEAYAREPSHPGVAMRVGSFLIYCGRTSDAAPYIKAAIDQDPVDPRKYALLWALHFCRGELEDALAAGQRIVDLGWPSMYLAVTSAALGRNDLAIEQYQLTKRLVNSIILPPVGSGTMTDQAMDAYWLMAAKGVCSGQESDRQIYFQVLEMMHATLHDKADLAITGPAMFTGNADMVFKAFSHSITPANILSFISLWADIDPIRQIWQHPEFIPFAQRIGLADAWDKYGWPDLLPPPSNRA